MGVANSRRIMTARALSILGHPALLTPAVAAGAMLAKAADGGAALQTLIAVGGVTAAVMAYAWWQVGRGRWGHIDAIQPAERRSFNGAALLLLVSAALLALLTGAPQLGLGLAAAALVIAAAIALAGRLKLSQHVAFAFFAAALASYIDWWAVAGVGALAIAVAWSRLELKRHTRAEVVVGAVVGTAAGLLLLGETRLSL